MYTIYIYVQKVKESKIWTAEKRDKVFGKIYRKGKNNYTHKSTNININNNKTEIYKNELKLSK